MSATPQDFKGSRLDAGLAVVDSARTQYEIASMLGKPSGSIHGLLRRMAEDGLLQADSNPPTRGTLYTIHPEAREALLTAAEGFLAPGSLVEHQRLLSVSGSPRRKAMELLASPALSGAVSWVARTNSVDALLVAMAPEADDVLVDALVIAFEDAGFEYQEGMVTQIMSARDVRAHNKTVSARAKGSS